MMDEFDEEFSDFVNFVLWRTYIEMVEIRLGSSEQIEMVIGLFILVKSRQSYVGCKLLAEASFVHCHI